jgi:Thioredoxin
MDLTKDCFGGKTLKGRAVILFSSSNSVLGNKYYTEVTTSVPNVQIHRVNIDKEKDLASDLNIRVSPVVLTYQDGVLLNSYTYKQKDDLICFLKS